MSEAFTEPDGRIGTREAVKKDLGIPGEREIVRGIEHVKEVAKGVAHNVSDAASYVRQKAESATTAVGGAMEDSGHYLRDDGINKIAGELTNLIRRNPLSSMLAGVGIGILIARSAHRHGGRSSRHGEPHA